MDEHDQDKANIEFVSTPNGAFFTMKSSRGTESGPRMTFVLHDETGQPWALRVCSDGQLQTEKLGHDAQVSCIE